MVISQPAQFNSLTGGAKNRALWSPFLLPVIKYKGLQMDIREHNTWDLIRSLEAEAAKSLSELRQAQSDLDKVHSRLRFILTVIHIIKERLEDETNTINSKTPTNKN